MRDTERQRHRQRETQAPCREPYVELNLRILSKADAQPLSHPGIPDIINLLVNSFKKHLLKAYYVLGTVLSSHLVISRKPTIIL